VDLAAYRLLQEALTNVVKHAGPSRAIVTLDFRKSELIVSVRNDGRRSSVKPNNGFGLIGMRERVELAGGDLQVEAIPDGFQVRARLPIGRLAVGSTEAVLANPGEAAESMLVDSPLVGP
jgi:signal transduction histidine kinase